MSPMLSSAGDRVDATAILFLAMDNAKSTDLHTQLPVLPKYAIIWHNDVRALERWLTGREIGKVDMSCR